MVRFASVSIYIVFAKTCCFLLGTFCHVAEDTLPGKKSMHIPMEKNDGVQSIRTSMCQFVTYTVELSRNSFFAYNDWVFAGVAAKISTYS